MKLFSMLFFAALMSAPALASSTVQLIHLCKNDIVDATVAVRVQEVHLVNVNGDIRHETQVNVASGWMTSGTIAVNVVAAADGGPVVYYNDNAGFSLVVRSRGVNAAGRAAQIIIEGHFIDTLTGRKIDLGNPTLDCR